MKIRKEVLPHIGMVWIVTAMVVATAVIAGARWTVMIMMVSPLLAVLTGYLLWFFRDPDRDVPEDECRLLSAADGTVTSITRHTSEEFRKICLDSGMTDAAIAGMKEFSGLPVIRISVFLSLMDVHVNRAPIGGESEFLGYFPGKHLFTMNEKSSAVNQHNAIRISNGHTGCLIFQIVGPVARRVVYWPEKSRPVAVSQGERIGMMKFGSRLDLYLPEPHIRILVNRGDSVTGGVTPVAELKQQYQ